TRRRACPGPSGQQAIAMATCPKTAGELHQLRSHGDPRRADVRLPPLRPAAKHPAHFGVPDRGDLLVLVVYLAAAAVYVLIGVFVTDLLLSVFVGVGYLFVAVWLVPAAVRRAL